MEEFLDYIIKFGITIAIMIIVGFVLYTIEIITKIIENIKEAKAYELIAEETEEESKALAKREKREHEAHQEFLRVQKVIEKEEQERTKLIRESINANSYKQTKIIEKTKLVDKPKGINLGKGRTIHG